MKDCAGAARGAAEWFLTIESTQDPDAETLQAWLRWLESSEDNRRAFEEIAQVWHSTPSAVIARRSGAAEKEEYDGSISVAEWRARMQTKPPAQPVEAALTQDAHHRHDRMPAPYGRWAVEWPRRRPALAVAAAAALGVAVVLAYQQRTAAPISSGEFVTRTAEHRELRLADGSRVTLGGHSRLTVDLRPTVRSLHLQGGEAYFAVNKDPARPFVVRALEGAITAVGTSFNVRTVADRVTVTVTEGSVKVTGDEASRPVGTREPTGNRLIRGEQLTYRSGSVVPGVEMGQVKRVAVADSARWRTGWLVYRDEPLEYVVADMARYTDLQLEVAASAAQVQFSGAVSKDRIGEWIAALPEVAQVSVARNAQGFVIVARAAP